MAILGPVEPAWALTVRSAHDQLATLVGPVAVLASIESEEVTVHVAVPRGPAMQAAWTVALALAPIWRDLLLDRISLCIHAGTLTVWTDPVTMLGISGDSDRARWRTASTVQIG